MEVKCRLVKQGVTIDLGLEDHFVFFNRKTRCFHKARKRRNKRRRTVRDRFSTYVFLKDNFTVEIPDELITKLFSRFSDVLTNAYIDFTVNKANDNFKNLSQLEQELFIIRIEEEAKKIINKN